MSKNMYICDCNAIHSDIVNKTNSLLPSDEQIIKVSSLFKMIGDPTRCKIISVLLINSMCVCDICNILSMTKSSVSHQLTKLRDSKLVKCERNGKEIIYSLEDEHVKEIISLTLIHIKHEEINYENI